MRKYAYRGYVHMVDGRLATYEPLPWPALITVQPRGKTYPEAGGVVVRTLRTLRAQQRRAVAAYPAKGRDRFAASLGYTVLDLPDHQLIRRALKIEWGGNNSKRRRLAPTGTGDATMAETPRHPPAWEDDGMVGIDHCGTTRLAERIHLTTDDDEPVVCQNCGCTLTLHWNVYVEAVPDGTGGRDDG